MKYPLIKEIIVLFLALFPVCAAPEPGDRPKRPPLSEFTNPKSPSYTPCPYPTDEWEVMKNLHYYVTKYVNSPKRRYAGADNSPNTEDMILRGIFTRTAEYKVLYIRKTELRSDSRSESHYWLLYIANPGGEIVSRAVMTPEGLYGSQMTLDLKHHETLKGDSARENLRGMAYLDAGDVMEFFRQLTGKRPKPAEVQSIKLVSWDDLFSEMLTPVWEIIFKNGDVYYYHEERHALYRPTGRKMRRPRAPQGYRTGIGDQYRFIVYIMDSLNEQIIELGEFRKR